MDDKKNMQKCSLTEQEFSFQRFSYDGEELNSSNMPTIVVLYSKSNPFDESLAFGNLLNESVTQVFSLCVEDNAIGNAKNQGINKVPELLQAFYEYIKSKYSLRSNDISILSHGILAMPVTNWIIDFAPMISSAIFFKPVFLFSQRDAVLHWYRLMRWGNKSAVSISVSLSQIKGIVHMGERIKRGIFSYGLPTLMFMSAADIKNKKSPCHVFLSEIASQNVDVHAIDDVSMQAGREPSERNMVNITLDFVNKNMGLQVGGNDLFDAYLFGVTNDEYNRILMPEKNMLKRFYWYSHSLFLKYIGRYSNGINIGLEYGFDSGANFDYIYKNVASGKNYIGKLIDMLYLKDSTWECVRTRESNVEKLMLMAMALLHNDNKKIRILDTAAGHGRYIINALKKSKYKSEHVVMRDFELSNVIAGNAFVLREGFDNIAYFEQGDAFSSDDLASLPTGRTLTVVSGLYELFSDNNMILTSLKGIADATDPGGYIVYTTKLWNPKLEYMARVLTSHKDKKRWVLRRRTQLEIDQLLAKSGFEKVTQRIDDHGLFSVCLARKI